MHIINKYFTLSAGGKKVPYKIYYILEYIANQLDNWYNIVS